MRVAAKSAVGIGTPECIRLAHSPSAQPRLEFARRFNGGVGEATFG